MDVITGFLIEGSLAKQYEYLTHLVENSTSEEEEMLAMSLRTAIAKTPSPTSQKLSTAL